MSNIWNPLSGGAKGAVGVACLKYYKNYIQQFQF